MASHRLQQSLACAVGIAALSLLSVGCDQAGRATQNYEHARAAFARGDLAQAVKEAADNAKRWEKSSASPWFWKFRLLTAEVLTTQSKYREAERLLAQGEPSGPELEQLRARYLIDRAALEANGKGNAAAEFLRQARQIAKEPEILIRLDLNEGNIAVNLRDHARAENLFHAALDRAVDSENVYYQGVALNNLSVTSKRLNRYEASIDYALRAIKAAEKAGARRTVALAEGNLGTAYAYLGQFDSALEYEKRAVASNEAMGVKSAAMTYLGELGLTYDRMGRRTEAIAQYQRAYGLANELGLKRDAERFAENLSTALIGTKQWDEAARWNDNAWAMANETGANASIPYLIRNRAEIAWGRGQSEEAERLSLELLKTHAEQPIITWEAYSLLGEIETAGKRYLEANRHFEAGLQTIEGTRSELLDPNFRVTLLARLIPFYREYVDALIVQGDNLRALRVVESSRARVLAERLGRDFRAERFADTKSLQNFARTANVSLLSFWIAPKRSFVWLIDPKGVRRFDLPDENEVESLVTAYRGVVEHSIADPLKAPEGRALWDKLLAPVAGPIPKDARVIVIPDGPLHRLNLETLPAPTPKPHYWIEDVELAVSPSISLAMSKAGARSGDARLLAIGAPDYAGSQYDALPGAANEMRQLQAKFLGATAITGAGATPASYRDAGPEKFSLIHFAAHAEANVEKPLESAVVLSQSPQGFKLYAREVIDVPIRADLVTLSACTSAGETTYHGEGLMGFAWAFLRAGSKAVVAGLWDVSDGATGPLMTKFYDGVAAGTRTACALRDAKLAMLREGRFRKAFYWGAFQTYLASGY
jgi:CHAT domain-containing protein